VCHIPSLLDYCLHLFSQFVAGAGFLAQLSFLFPTQLCQSRLSVIDEKLHLLRFLEIWHVVLQSDNVYISTIYCMYTQPFYLLSRFIGVGQGLPRKLQRLLL